MVLQIGADPGAVGDDLDAHVTQMRRRADARQHQQFGRVEGRGCDNDLTVCADCLDLAAALDFNTDGLAVFDDDPARQAFDQLQVGALQRRPEIGIGRRPAPSPMDRLFHRPEAFLLLAVIVFGHLKPGLLSGLDEAFIERVFLIATADMQRAFGAAPALLSAMGMFHPLEIGQHIRIGPAVGAGLGPAVKIFRMAAHIDHAVDGGGAANDLAARRGEPTPAQMRFRFGFIPPVVDSHAHRIGQGSRHLDEGSGIGAAIFQHDDRVFSVLGQPAGHG